MTKEEDPNFKLALHETIHINGKSRKIYGVVYCPNHEAQYAILVSYEGNPGPFPPDSMSGCTKYAISPLCTIRDDNTLIIPEDGGQDWEAISEKKLYAIIDNTKSNDLVNLHDNY